MCADWVVTLHADVLSRAHESRLASTLVLLQQTQVNTSSPQPPSFITPHITTASATIRIIALQLTHTNQESLASEKVVSCKAMLELSRLTQANQLQQQRAEAAAAEQEARTADSLQT